MNEIDIPDFKKQKKGKGAIKDFIKKHKTKIEVASGLAALSLPFLTYLAMRDNAKENKPLTEAQVMALPQRERDIQEALARERVKGTSRENLPMYPPSGGPTQKQMDDAFLESIKKSYRDRGIERFKDNGKTYFSGYVKPSAQEERKEERKESGYPSGLPQPRAPREILPPPPKRHLGFFVVPPEIRSPRSDGSQTSLSHAPVPQAIPLKPEHKAFLETKKGRGFIDWIKKHKRELGIGATTIGSLGALALAIAAGDHYIKYKPKELSPQDKGDIYRAVGRDPVSSRGDLGMYLVARGDDGGIGRPSGSPGNIRNQIEVIKNIRTRLAESKGNGKPNKLAKQVMEYKKKHNVTLKEAWAHFK